MAQETWGLKLDQEIKDKLQGIIKDDFGSSKEFIEKVINLYEMDKLEHTGTTKAKPSRAKATTKNDI